MLFRGYSKDWGLVKWKWLWLYGKYIPAGGLLDRRLTWPEPSQDHAKDWPFPCEPPVLSCLTLLVVNRFTGGTQLPTSKAAKADYYYIASLK